MKEKPKVIVILGPTSSGKTELSLKLAKKFNGIIISADSRQIYKGLDIATAKTTKDHQQNIPHYMIDIIDPDEDFNVSLYQTSVYNLLNSITRRNTKCSKKTIPFIVGGTGLYIKAIVDGYKIPPIPPNKQFRAKLERLSLRTLTQKLKQLSAGLIKPHIDLTNKRRIIRAIEIIKAAGKILLEAKKPNFNFLQIGINPPPEILNQRIENKVDEMYKTGLVKEAKKLLAQGYNFDEPAFSALGYRHIYRYFRSRITLKKALELMKQETKKFAKRQMTWFKKDKRIHWVKDYKEAEKLIQNFLK